MKERLYSKVVRINLRIIVYKRKNSCGKVVQMDKVRASGWSPLAGNAGEDTLVTP